MINQLRSYARTCRPAARTASFAELILRRPALLVVIAIALLTAAQHVESAFASQQGRRGPGLQPNHGMQPNPAWDHTVPGRFGTRRPGMQQQGPHEHLPEWFRQHENLPPDAQERALRTEPGFDRLPPQEQQRLYERLRQLDAMPPARRERTLQRMEALEMLSPHQREQVRNAMQQVTQMPPDRKRMLRKAFRDLSQLPPDQRKAAMKSSQFQQQFSKQERNTLAILMSVQPYTPVERQPANSPAER